MTDVYVFESLDGGNVTDQVELTGGYETAVYLSLFGGNQKDDGSAATRREQWCLNSIIPAANRMTSRTQNLLARLPAAARNLALVEQAVISDLSWLRDDEDVEISAEVSIPAVNRVSIAVSVDGIRYAFLEDWITYDRT